MNKTNKYIYGAAIAMLLTFIGALCLITPNIHGFWNWLMEVVLVGWCLVVIIFLTLFRKFNKEEIKKGS